LESLSTMSGEIKVSVFKYPDRRNLVLGYDDPLTGKRVTKSAKTSDPTAAERAAAVWQDELTSGRYVAPLKMTWQDFRQRYEKEKLQSLAPGSLLAARITLDYIEEIVNPDRLAKITADVVSRFQSKLRDRGIKETTTAHHMRNVKAALRWAVSMGLLAKCPNIEMPKVPRGQSLMKGRPITGEEFDRMITAASEVRPHDAVTWTRFLTGLWLSGLRLEEACSLSWDEDAPFSVDLSGRRPVFRILAAAQKARRDELLPMTPDFAEWLLNGTLEAERHGKVFKITTTRGAQPFHYRHVGCVVSAIGKKAGVVVATVEKRRKDKETGKLVSVTVKKFASAHDLRRAFGTRWSKKVMPPALQRLMRHSDLSTTMKYYVSVTAAELADELWAKYAPEGEKLSQGNKQGNRGPKGQKTGSRKNDAKSLQSKANADAGT